MGYRASKDLKVLTGHTEFLLPSLVFVKRVMSENNLDTALRRMGNGAEEMTAQGFRASFSTLANESGLWNPDAIERALVNVEASDVRRAYERGDHWEERVQVAASWAEKREALAAAFSLSKGEWPDGSQRRSERIGPTDHQWTFWRADVLATARFTPKYWPDDAKDFFASSKSALNCALHSKTG